MSKLYIVGEFPLSMFCRGGSCSVSSVMDPENVIQSSSRGVVNAIEDKAVDKVVRDKLAEGGCYLHPGENLRVDLASGDQLLVAKLQGPAIKWMSYVIA